MCTPAVALHPTGGSQASAVESLYGVEKSFFNRPNRVGQLILLKQSVDIPYHETNMPPKLVVIGSGWAGYTVAHRLDANKYEITVISPEPSTPYTPLLASAACGWFNFSLAEEPVRHKSRSVGFVQARVDDIDFEGKKCVCSPAFIDLSQHIFEVEFDYIVLAPGCTNQTFGTPGVEANAIFVRNVMGAMAVRQRVLDIFEMASLPFMTDEEQRNLLHIVVVGGGPTGVEISAETLDLIHNDFSALYPDLAGKASVAIHDVAAQILSPFDTKLSEHALASFKHRCKLQRRRNYAKGGADRACSCRHQDRVSHHQSRAWHHPQ